MRASLDRLEGPTEALHSRGHLVRWPQIEKENAVLVLADHLFQTRGQFNAPTRSQTTLEHRQLQAVAVPFNDGQHTAPTLTVGNVVCDDEETLFRHGRSARCVVRDARDLTHEMTREKSALYRDDAPHADPISEDRMNGFLIEPSFPRRDQRLAP